MNGRSRREYLEVIYSRYRRAELEEKQVILNEFCRNTGYNRKYAIRLLNAPAPNPRGERPRRRRRAPTYSAGVIAVLGAVWEAAGYPCAVRLKALLPLWMPWEIGRASCRERVKVPVGALCFEVVVGAGAALARMVAL